MVVVETHCLELKKVVVKKNLKWIMKEFLETLKEKYIL